MSLAYLDTSVLVAFYVPETFSAVAERRVRKATARAISDLTVVELAAALARKVCGGVLAPSAARRVQTLFREQVAEGYYSHIPLARRHYDAAAELAMRTAAGQPVRSLDAIHAAVAMVHGLVLVTADKRLASVAQAFGLEVDLVEA